MALLCLTGCFHSPVLDTARSLPEDIDRYEVMVAMTTSPSWTARRPGASATADTETAQSAAEQYNNSLQIPALGFRYDKGLGGSLMPAQAGLFAWSSGVLGVRAKFQFVETGILSMAFGLGIETHLLFLLANSLDDNQDADHIDTGIVGFTLPLWLGLRPAPWLSLYVTERMQLWLANVESPFPGALLLQTAGIQLGETSGIMGEFSFVYSPRFDDLVPQIAFSFFYTGE